MQGNQTLPSAGNADPAVVKFDGPQVALVADAMRVRRAELIAMPLDRVWRDLAEVAIAKSAAPDMLAALKDARQFFEDHMDELFGIGHAIPMAVGASLTISTLDRAIAKATSAP